MDRISLTSICSDMASRPDSPVTAVLGGRCPGRALFCSRTLDQQEQQCRACHSKKCTGNGLVVPSSSHKQKVAGSIPAGCTKTFLFPFRLLPHQLMSSFDDGRHLSFHKKICTRHRSNNRNNSSTRPHGEKEGATTTVYWRGAERGE
jgi:RNA polymerase subunit RPABC4/transcription elongation factor Spt4